MNMNRRTASWAAGAAIGLLAAISAAPTMAGAGHWVYQGQWITPPPEDRAAVKAGPGHIYEERLSGGFQAGTVSIGTIDIAVTTDNADRKVYVAKCTSSFRIEADLAGGATGVAATSGIVQTEGNDMAKGNGGYCTGDVAIDNGDYGARTDHVSLGTTGNASGHVTIPSGTPGATMTIHIGGYLSSGNGAASATLHAGFKWAAD